MGDKHIEKGCWVMPADGHHLLDLTGRAPAAIGSAICRSRVVLVGWGHEIKKLQQLATEDPKAYRAITLGELMGPPEIDRATAALASPARARRQGPTWLSKKRRGGR